MTTKVLQSPAQRQLIFFLFRALGIYLGWFLLYNFWLKPEGTLDQLLTRTLAEVSTFLLRSSGLLVSFTHLPNLTTLQAELASGSRAILDIAHFCNGQVLLALFAGFILSVPGKLIQKAWFIPAGMAGIFGLNVFRVCCLMMIQVHAPEWLDFNHKYTFTLLVYAGIFSLWMIWVKYFLPRSI